MGNKKLYFMTPELEASLRENYKGSPRERSKAIARLVAETCLPKWWIRKKVAELGLTMRGRNWSDANLHDLPDALLLGKEEAARLLGIGVSTVSRYIALGELPVRRVGRRVLVTRRALEQFARRDHAPSHRRPHE